MASLEVPPSESTAPVFEYRCLFTQDLRRKQKRWQDGKLTFHTFNRRIMVFDERSNFVGDTHWRDGELSEGEELELERRGILVEVGGFVAQRNQDVSELTHKLRKDKEDRAAARAAASPASFFREPGTPASEYLKPKPLNQMLTPTGHYGRAAIPTFSPFEERERQADRTINENERPAKRRKQAEPALSKSGYAQNLTGVPLSLSSSRPPSTAKIRYEPLKLKASIQPKPVASIDLTLDSDDDEDKTQNQGGQKSQGGEDKIKERSASIQRKYKKSPVRKSGYASNLTGASLSLSRRVEVPSRGIGNHQVERFPRQLFMNHDEELSTAEGDSSFAACSPGEQTTPIATFKKSILDKVVSKPISETIIDSPFSSPIRVEIEQHTKTQPKKFIVATSSRPSRPSPHRQERKAERVERQISPESRSLPHNMRVKPRASSRNHSPGQRILAYDGSARDNSSSKATSSLRIKSRPRQKMMMLMNLSSSCGSTHMSSPGTRANSTPKRRPTTAADDTVLSQATINLNNFCKRQEEQLEARLCGQKSNKVTEDTPDSPAHTGTDCLAPGAARTDKLHPMLPSKGEYPEPQEQEVPKVARVLNDATIQCLTVETPDSQAMPSKTRVEAAQNYVSGSWTRSSPEIPSHPALGIGVGQHKPDNLGGISTLGSLKSINNSKQSDELAVSSMPVIAAVLTNVQATTNLMGTNFSTSSQRKLSAPFQTAHTSPISNMMELESASREASPPFQDSQSLFLRTTNITAMAPCPGSPSERLHAKSQIHIESRITSPAMNQGESTRQNTENPSTRSTRTTSDANANPTDKLNEAHSRKINMHRGSNIVSESLQSERSEMGLYITQERPGHTTSTKQQPMDNSRQNVAFLGEPEYSIAKHIPVELQELIQESRAEAMPSLEVDPISMGLLIDSSPEPSSIELRFEGREMQLPPAAKTIEPVLPRAKMANPATRGKSLQSIACSTVDTKALAFKSAMPPPPPISRINQSNPRASVTMGHIDEEPEPPRAGPWSRESFDLFGTWKPPDRNQGRNIAAA